MTTGAAGTPTMLQSIDRLPYIVEFGACPTGRMLIADTWLTA